MKILHDLIENTEALPVKDIILGIFSTLVVSEKCGISSTQSEADCHGRAVKDADSLLKKNTRQLAEYALSKNLHEASIGIAAINSAMSIDFNKAIKRNAKDIILSKGKGKTVGVIGHFPFLNKIKGEFKELYIFEKSPLKGDLTEKDIPEYLPSADVAAISGTTLINHTLEDILKNVKKSAYIIMLGPSVPLSPLLFDYGISAAGGSVVIDAPSVITQVKLATPFKFMTGVEHFVLGEY